MSDIELNKPTPPEPLIVETGVSGKWFATGIVLAAVALLLFILTASPEDACAATDNTSGMDCGETETYLEYVDEWTVSDMELDEQGYRRLDRLIEQEPIIKPAVKKALADGQITVGEFQADIEGVIRQRDEALRDAARDRAKEVVVKKVGHPADDLRLKNSKDAIPI